MVVEWCGVLYNNWGWWGIILDCAQIKINLSKTMGTLMDRNVINHTTKKGWPYSNQPYANNNYSKLTNQTYNYEKLK